MDKQLEQLRASALAEITGSPSVEALEEVRVKYLGRNGGISALSEAMKMLGNDKATIASG